MRMILSLTSLLMIFGRVTVADFVNFETAHVRPLAITPEGDFLYAASTPDNRVEVLEPDGTGLRHVGDVVVGLEPAALALHGRDELWVVNHLSDSVSVVDVSDPSRPFVRETLLVGDEPRDIVFAGRDDSGPTNRFAYITAAHRGQNRPGDPQLTTPGVGRADVWVFDTEDLTRAPHIITLFADTPRGLAVSPDGGTVYAAAFRSGNQTTAIHELAVSSDPDRNEEIGDGFTGLGMPPLPEDLPNTTGRTPPETSIRIGMVRTSRLRRSSASCGRGARCSRSPPCRAAAASASGSTAMPTASSIATRSIRAPIRPIPKVPSPNRSPS